MQNFTRSATFKRALRSSFGAAILLLIWAAWTPIPFQLLKIAQIGAAIWLWLGALWLWPRARLALLPLSLAALMIWLWPTPTAAIAPDAYVAALRNYAGVPYVWGGENARGLDCSGLMRRAMQDALWRQGWQKRNPALWRAAVGLWWRDASAKAMKSGDGGRVIPLFEARDLNALDLSRVQPGDMAVTQSGVHVLAYVGRGAWIEADPNLINGGDKVIVVRTPTPNAWFGQPVVICRWIWLVR